MRVLVVDDDPVGLMLACSVVESLGHHVRSATDGEQAWQYLTEDAYDVLVTDRQMPGLGGLALCQRVRDRSAAAGNGQHAGDSYCYVVLLTVQDGDDHAMQGLLAGADDYLSKPLNGQELRRRLIVAQRFNDLHRQLRQQHRELAAVGRDEQTLATSAVTAPPVASPEGAPPADGSVDLSVLDQMHALGTSIGRDLADEIVQTWLRQSKQSLGALQDALETRDDAALRGTAHVLKGSSATVGATELSAVCDQLEHSDHWDARLPLLDCVQQLTAEADSALVDHLQRIHERT